MLTNEKIDKIINLHNEGKDINQISTIMNISSQTVQKYIKSSKDKTKKSEEDSMITTEKYAVNALVENKYDPSIATDTIIHLHLIGKTLQDIASEAHVNYAVAEDYIKVYESSKTLILPHRGNRVVTEAVYDKMIRMYTGEAGIADIAKSLKISEPLVGRYITSYRTYMTGGNHKPVKTKNSKIDLKELVELKKAGFTTAEMAGYFDVVEGSINERLLEAKRNGMLLDIEKARTEIKSAETEKIATAAPKKEQPKVVTPVSKPEPVKAPVVETVKPEPVGSEKVVPSTTTAAASLEVTVIGDKAMTMVDKLMKFKDSTVTLKDIAELSALLESAKIRKYKLVKK